MATLNNKSNDLHEAAFEMCLPACAFVGTIMACFVHEWMAGMELPNFHCLVIMKCFVF